MSKVRQMSKRKLHLALDLQNNVQASEDLVIQDMKTNPFDVLSFDIDSLMIWIETCIKCRVNLKKRIITTDNCREGYKFDYFLLKLENNAMFAMTEQHHKVEIL